MTPRDPAEKLDAIVRLAMDITHKVNNSLASALNYVFILREAYSDETAKQLLKKIEKGIHSSKDTLQELVDLSHPSAGMPESIDIVEGFKVIVSGFAGLEFKMDFKGSPQIKASRLSLGALMTKLLDNALEAGATVMRIRGMEEDGNMALFISDNGCGMTGEQIGRVFEPFFSTKTGHKGLGLYTAYHIVRSMGGNIRCRSLPGGGIEFRIDIPKS